MKFLVLLTLLIPSAVPAAGECIVYEFKNAHSGTATTHCVNADLARQEWGAQAGASCACPEVSRGATQQGACPQLLAARDFVETNVRHLQAAYVQAANALSLCERHCDDARREVIRTHDAWLAQRVRQINLAAAWNKYHCNGLTHSGYLAPGCHGALPATPEAARECAARGCYEIACERQAPGCELRCTVKADAVRVGDWRK